MGKVIRYFCWHQNVVPKGLHATRPGAIYMYKIIKKMCRKSDFREIFLKLVTMTRVTRCFYLHLTYSKNGGHFGLVLKIKNMACLSILLTNV